MSNLKKAYRLDGKKQKIYEGICRDAFVLPENAKGYKEYIDTLYEASSSLSPIEAVKGADIVADAMISDIINSPDTIKATGKTYYISNSGNDENDGLSPETAWATIDKLRAETPNLEDGDAVLFERGGEWRKRNEYKGVKIGASWDDMAMFKAVSGVSYGAYGSGDKPILNGSEYNYANSAIWKETGIENVYVCTEEFWNVGIVALNHNKRKLGKYNEKNALKEIIGLRSFMGVADLRIDCSYFLDVKTHKLYFCSNDGNPGDRFDSIEIGGRLAVIMSMGAALIENFNIKFSGYGVSAHKSMNVKNCIFSYLGGCQLSDEPTQKNLCGNAIEIYGECDGFNAESCWMYQLCDTGVTHQLWTDKEECIQKNISFKGNVIEYCHWGVEFNNPPSVDGTKRVIENFEHSYNVVRNGGEGWADIQFGRESTATLYNCFGTNKCINGVCEKNIFAKSSGPIYRMRFDGDKSIKYIDNMNIQYENGLLGYLYDKDYPYDSDAEERLKQSAIVESGIYIYLE